MKKNFGSVFGFMLATSLLAQTSSNPPPAPAIETPAPAPLATNVAPAPAQTNAPAAKKKKAPRKPAEKKPAPKSAAAELRTVPLVPGPAVVDANHVNVRGQAKLKSEVVNRLNKGQQVTVLQEIVHNNSGPDEPSAWAKILLPTNTHVYVNSRFIDATNQTVKPKKLRVRSGPGENYSILAELERGDQIKEIGKKGEWLQIEPPASAYAFVASQFLKQEAPGTAVAEATPTPTEPMPTPAPVTEPPPIAAAPTEPPATAPTSTAPITPPPAETPAVTNAPTETAATTPPDVEEPPPKRIVQREGKVRATVSIQAPTKFSLYSPDTGRTIDYLFTTSPNLDLRRYKGLDIIVTGEESLDERWGNTPVITIQKIQVMDEAP